MHLLPRERDKLYLREIGLLAQTRLARGLRLNETETIALLSTVLHEMARSGQYTVACSCSVVRRSWDTVTFAKVSLKSCMKS